MCQARPQALAAGLAGLLEAEMRGRSQRGIGLFSPTRQAMAKVTFVAGDHGL